ncbi:hypothetical protein HELRODRAFT_161037 [Helobdella robusta]|uniref:WSC domain-containing protein n=1 Tax=Helobdella robusta TaxID=6412 RepID=T1ER16_HELRO|nr:hypothetical protein HELRODRAFT_161037 [Helobdella robusta]ESO01859.1 hypothetical protein HELRODRAFT_161037 [Helobdella robusta]
MSFDIICFLFKCCFIIGKVFSSKALSEVGYIFNGCYKDSALNPDMSAYSSVIATPEPDLCCRKCQKLGRPYCGLQKSTYCFCGEDYGDYGLSTECTNNPSCQSLVCGGSSSNSIYYSIGNVNLRKLLKNHFALSS